MNDECMTPINLHIPCGIARLVLASLREARPQMASCSDRVLLGQIGRELFEVLAEEIASRQGRKL